MVVKVTPRQEAMLEVYHGRKEFFAGAPRGTIHPGA